MSSHSTTFQKLSQAIKSPIQISSRESKSAKVFKDPSNQKELATYRNQMNLHQAQCNLCVKELGISNPPKCSEHKYCKKCLNLRKKPDKRINCENCRNYFEALLNPLRKDTIRCLSCLIYPNSSRFCCDHSYCIKCLEFFKQADLSCFYTINDCKICFNYIKIGIIANTTRAKTPELYSKAQPIQNFDKVYSFAKQTKEITTKSNELLFQGSKSSRDYVSDYMKTKENPNFIPNSSFLHSDIKTTDSPIKNKISSNPFIKKSQEIQNVTKISLPTQESQLKAKKIENQTDNSRYKEKNSLNLTPKTMQVETKARYDKLRSITPDLNQKQNEPKKQKSLRDISPLNLKLQINNKLIGNAKKEFIEGMITHKKNNMTSSRIKYLASQRNSLANLLPSCSICKSKEKVRGFNCNHNLCLKCTVNTGIAQINDFFDLYKDEDHAAYFQFFYVCPEEECSECISIPCLLITKHLPEYIDSKEIGFEKYSTYRNWSYKDWSQWISYFDGIGFYDT